MGSTEPPAGSTPPPGEPAPPPPPPPEASAAAPPYSAPTNPGTYPPPPPPPAGAAGPAPGMPGAAYGPGQPGSLLDRFVARLVDLIIVGVVSSIIRTVLFNIGDSYFLGYLVDAVVTAAISLGYFAYLESSRGQTLGKMIMKLQTVAPDGSSNPTMNEAVKRNIWTGAGILGVLWLPGYFLAFVVEVVSIILCAVGINSDPQRQHWFDKFAGGTRVLKVG